MLKQKINSTFLASLLFFLTVLIYFPVIRFTFLSFDDLQFILGNPFIAQGLTPQSVKWAFTAELLEPSPYADFWHPLAFLSHILDIELFGTQAGAHHMVNVFWHSINAMLVFYLIERLFKNNYLSFMVAAIFAWHPVQVETVAWIFARKHLLGAFWLFLALHVYKSYVEKKSLPLFFMTGLFYLFSLMSKFNFLGFGFLLLLLDYWPLNRLNKNIWFKCAAEKIPFIIAALMFLWSPLRLVKEYASAYWVDNMAVVISSLLTNLTAQLWKLVYPLDLGMIRSLTLNTAARVPEMYISLIVLVFISVGVWFARKKQPSAFWGWSWFLIILLPVSSFRWPADRFLYAAIIGAALFAVYSINQSVVQKDIKRLMAVTLIALMVLLTQRQLAFWKDDIAFYKRGIEVSGDSYLFHNNLANAYVKNNEIPKAISHYEEAIVLLDKDPLAYLNLSAVYLELGDYTKAAEMSARVLSMDPNNPKARFFMTAAEQMAAEAGSLPK